MPAIESIISGVGSFLPERMVTNDDLAKNIDTSDEWIRARTGITKRYFADDETATSDIAVEAAKRAIEHAGLTPDDIDLIIMATVTPDKTFPATAVFVQAKLGVPRGMAFDVSAACTGFTYAVSIAHNFITAGQVKNALVIGGEKLSCFLDWDDRATSVLFGDGAGAIILSATPPQEDGVARGILSAHLSADGRLADHLYADGGPSTTGTVGKVRMNGKEVFRNAVEQISGSVLTVAEKAGVLPGDIDWFIPHQANVRIIEACSKRLNFDDEKIIVTIQEHANTSSASIPLALDTAIKDGRVQRDQLLAFSALGGGLAWGGVLLRY